MKNKQVSRCLSNSTLTWTFTITNQPYQQFAFNHFTVIKWHLERADSNTFNISVSIWSSFQIAKSDLGWSICTFLFPSLDPKTDKQSGQNVVCSFLFHFCVNSDECKVLLAKSVWGFLSVGCFWSACEGTRVCVCLREAQWVGESGSAGTHSCLMVLFQEELLDLCVFTGSQFVCLCIFASIGWVLVPFSLGHSSSPPPPPLPSVSAGLPLKVASKFPSSPSPRHTLVEQIRLSCDSSSWRSLTELGTDGLWFDSIVMRKCDLLPSQFKGHTAIWHMCVCFYIIINTRTKGSVPTSLKSPMITNGR